MYIEVHKPSVDEQLQRILEQICVLQHDVLVLQLTLNQNKKTYPWNREKETQYDSIN